MCLGVLKLAPPPGHHSKPDVGKRHPGCEGLLARQPQGPLVEIVGRRVVAGKHGKPTEPGQQG